MKYLILFLAFQFMVVTVYSQHQTIQQDTLQKIAYQMEGKDALYYDTPPPKVHLLNRIPPVFVGNMEQFLKDNLIYPEEAEKRKLEGYVTISCQIDSLGV